MPIRTVHVERDGQRLALRLHPGSGRRVLLLPAMGVPAGYYDGFAGLLTDAGFAVAVADLRGTGASTPHADRRSRYGYAELVDDVGALLAELDADAPLLIGHSLGGHAAALHLALGGTGAGLVLIASGTPYSRLYSGRAGAIVRGIAVTVSATSAMLGYWPGHRMGFGGRQARGLMRDWGYMVRTGRFPTLSAVDVEARLADVKVPVLGISIADDTYTPAQTLDHFCAKFTGAPVTRHHYTRAESGAPMNHFRWTRASTALVPHIAAFTATL